MSQCGPRICALRELVGGTKISPLPRELVTPWAPIMRKGVVDRPRRASRNPHACLGGSPQETRWSGPCVSVSIPLSSSMCLKCRSDFATLTPVDGTHLELAAIFLPSFLCHPCGTSACSPYRTGRFFLGILARGQHGKDGDPRGLRSAGGTRKGSIISGVLLAGMQHSHVGALLNSIC